MKVSKIKIYKIIFQVATLLRIHGILLKVYDKYHLISLKRAASRNNLTIALKDGLLEITKNKQKMILSEAQLRRYALTIINMFDFHFNDVVPEKINGFDVVDHSTPGEHTMKKSGLSFWFSSFAVDIPTEGYTHKYVPKEGDIIFDCGAWCGISTYFFSKLVGDSGKVYAFEPDNQNYGILLKNIEKHKLNNVVPIKKGLWSKTTTLQFSNEGDVNSSIADVYFREKDKISYIEVISLQDVYNTLKLKRLDFVKMDIEGAEVEVILNSKEFLENMDINFAIASYHDIGNGKSSEILENFFPKIGYICGTVYPPHTTTWAQNKNNRK